MSDLSAAHFAEFFQSLHGKDPFPWQTELAQMVCAERWPAVIDLPTASGKTACLDIALFSLAVTKTSARRIFFVVDRRVIVNEAFERMRDIATKLADAKSGILAEVASSLKEIAGGGAATPLDVYQLRGGVYRDQSWVTSPLQPTVITSTVDQVGSRLLFRGYGVSESSAPIHAALIANDSLIFLDEAHCSRAFSQTLSSVSRYRDSEWARNPLKKSFSFIEMTATPSRETDQPFRLTPADHQHQVLNRRLYAEKLTSLQLVKARANDRETLSQSLGTHALKLAKETGALRVAVMVNRVATARRVFEILTKPVGAENLHLLIGRMRPVDRDLLIEALNPLKAGAKRDAVTQPTFVVSTQCLEVGADLDFDVLVSECASIDAVLQRFGRLDRLGESSGKARGCIVGLSGIIDSKDPDPIYGQALAKTWHWLNTLAKDTVLNLGIESSDLAQPTVAQSLKLLPPETAKEMRRIGTPSPALLPAHLDAFVQTSPKPHADPEVALFLHGREEGTREIQVVWRADLDDVPIKFWKEIVALCPPVSAEAMPVRLDHFRRWLVGDSTSSIPDSDLEGAGGEADDEEKPRQQPVLIWRGDKSSTNAVDIAPNDTVILSLAQKGWDQFGHIPEPALDVAEQAIRQARGRSFLRVHKELWPASENLNAFLRDEEFDWTAWEMLAESNKAFLTSRGLTSFQRSLFKPPLPYPAVEGKPSNGWVLELRRKVRPACNASLEEDSGSDEVSYTENRISLERHTRDVAAMVARFSEKLLPDFVDTFKEAARLHDTGKADLRFQTMLHGGDRLAAEYYPEPLAKSDLKSKGLFRTARAKSGLPDHFRHELVSLHFAEKISGNRSDLNLLLHLIASHHGYCRPFAPVVLDDLCPAIDLLDIAITRSERLNNPAHNLSSGVARRFWSFTREFGWWGSAYLESCLRLADWAASNAESAEKETK